MRPSEAELNEIKANKIIETILLTDTPLSHIGKLYGWKKSSAKEINAGRNHHRNNLIYPLRQYREENKALLNL